MDDTIKKYINELKEFEKEHIYLPKIFEKKSYEATGLMTREKYYIDINRKSYTLNRKKLSAQNRVISDTILLRLDIDSKPHENPDGTLVGTKHIHVYQEYFGMSFAYELDDPKLHQMFSSFDFNRLNSSDLVDLFISFCDLCNIKEPEQISDSLC